MLSSLMRDMVYLGNTDVDAIFESSTVDDDGNVIMNEAGVDSSNKKFRIEIIDVDRFVKANDLKPITDPVFFNGPTPSPEGLLSNEIFGITKAERQGIFGYIDLGGWYINPLCYKTLLRLNSKVGEIIHGTDTFIINSNGEIVQDDDGDTGIDWFKKNFDKIKWKKTESTARNTKIKFIEANKNKMWINKYIVIPAAYRDVDTKQASIGVGEINKLYSQLIIASKAVKENADYGLSLADSTKGRIQTTLTQIYDWFGTGTTIGGNKTSGNLPGKTGLIKKGIMYKTIDYSVRLVMSAPQLKVEDIDDMMVDMDHAALPLAAALCNFKPFIVFWLRRFFENQFAGVMEYPVKLKSGDVINLPLEDYQIKFSDIEIDKEIERFIHGYSNRFIPISIPLDRAACVKMLKEKKLSVNLDNLYLKLIGHRVDPRDYLENKVNIEDTPGFERPLTWCDLFYMAACEMTEDKMVLITRFPIDSYLNQFPSQVNIKSTVKTEPVVINGKLYRWYPSIKKEDIGSNTSPLFDDTLSISNGLIEVMSLDYDGDTAIIKPVYTVEANAECRKVATSKIQMIGMDGKSPRTVSKECLLAIYEITNQPDPSVKLVDPIF